MNSFHASENTQHGRLVQAGDLARLTKILGAVRARDFQDAERCRTELSRLSGEYTAQLHGLIGPENLPRYLKLHERRMKQTRRRLRRSSLTFEDVLALEQGRRANMEKSRQLIGRSGVPVKAVESLQKEYLKLKSRTLAKLRGREEPSDAAVNLPARGARNPNTLVLTPPFIRPDSDVLTGKSDEASEPHASAHADAETGAMVGVSRIKVESADYDDHSFAKTFSLFGAAFRAVRSGRLTVGARLDAMCCSSFSGGIQRECGWRQDVEIYEDALFRVLVCNLTRNKADNKWCRISGAHGTRRPFHLTYPEQEPDGYGGWNLDWWEAGEPLRTFFYYYDVDCHEGDLILAVVELITTNQFTSTDFTVTSDLHHVYKVREIVAHHAG